jgi:hypothetical protein
MAPQLVSALEWQSLTSTVNDIKSPNTFLQNLLIGGRRNTHPTQVLEIGRWLADRKMVPFVKAGAQAFPLQGVSKEFHAVKAPNIRVKISFEPSPLLFGRTPDTKLFLRDGETQFSAVEQHIAADMQYMADQIANREEWLAAQAMTGIISYAGTDDVAAEAFEFNYARDAGHTVALGAGDRWNESTSDVAKDVRDAKRLVSEATGVQLTDVVMGKDAAEAFLNNAGVLAILDRRNTAGDESQAQRLGGDFQADGAYFCGRIFGLNWWEYNRTVEDADGSTVQLVAAKKAFFVSRNANAGVSMEYGAIPDMDAYEGGLIQVQRFSKSWVEKDPSVVVALTHTRPFVLLKRPEAFYELQVLA